MQDIQPDKFRFSLDVRGVDTEVLEQAPDGWLSTNIKYARSATYNGLVRSLTLPLKFVLYGAKILRRERYTYGVLARVNLLIEKLNPATWVYEKLYLGKLDFSKAQNENTIFTVNATENDLSINVAAYDSQQYTIPVNVPEAVTVFLTPLILREKAILNIINRNNPQSDTFPGLNVVDNRQSSVNASVQNVQSKFITDPDYTNEESWFYEAQTDTNLEIKIDFDIHLRAVGDGAYSIDLYRSDGTLFKHLYNFTGDEIVPVSIHQDIAGKMLKGQKLLLYFDANTDGTRNDGFYIDGTNTGTLTLNYDTVSPGTFTQGLRLDYIYNKLITLMNNNVVYPTQSFLLNGPLVPIVVTCSNAVRVNVNGLIYQAADTLQQGGRYLVLGGSITYNGEDLSVNTYFDYVFGVDNFTTNNDGFVRQVGLVPEIVISFQDFFKTIYAIQGGQAMFGIENGVAVLEDLSYGYRTGAHILDLGVVDDSWSEVPATDKMFNTIKVGYDDQQYTALNGYQEVNSLQYYKSDLTEPQLELDLVSPTRADPFGIEEDRVQPTDTAASRSDNKNYMIWLKDQPEPTDIGPEYYQPLRTEGLRSITGVDPSYYNWKLTPKQNMLRGGRYLKSIFDKMNGYFLVQTGHEKNVNLVTIDLNGLRVAERDDIGISTLPMPLFLPSYITVKPGLAYNALELMDKTPYGDISFTINGTVYYGFLQEVSVDEGENSTQTFKTLVTPANNLLTLVR